MGFKRGLSHCPTKFGLGRHMLGFFRSSKCDPSDIAYKHFATQQWEETSSAVCQASTKQEGVGEGEEDA